jgi:hypothetical protein
MATNGKSNERNLRRLFKLKKHKTPASAVAGMQGTKFWSIATDFEG